MRAIIPLLSLFLIACPTDSKPTDSQVLPGDTASCADADLDGFCAPEDCDDTDASIHPGAEERCDGLDNDCDGDTDEGDAADAATWYQDADGDGYGDPLVALTACEQPEDAVAVELASDCDDQDAAVNPDADELCDGVDNDCDGDIDEDDAVDAQAWYADVDGDGYGDPLAVLTACEQPEGSVGAELATDCDDLEATVYPGAEERCNGFDDDCNGVADDDYASDANTWYADVDGDGYGDADVYETTCAQPSGYVSDADDCDDSDPNINPGADEDTCNELDDDCDGYVDEWPKKDVDLTLTWYADADGDGYGDPDDTVADLAECGQPSGYVSDDTDCDDADASINPAADEYCDGVDSDCSGVADDDYALDASTWYADADGDGFGDGDNSTTACEAPSGYVEDDSDCDDGDASVHPEADEYCNGIDDDCDGDVDEDDAVDTLDQYEDRDGDGYGGALAGSWCEQASGYVLDSDDCDDSDASINPGAEEICDGVDNDCSGVADDDYASDADTWYADVDGDGYGDSEDSTAACQAPSGYIEDDSDCDDGDASTYPGADEYCDGVDSDCDGVADVLGYWPFEEGTGTVAYDEGPLALDGDIVDASWSSGVIGNGLDFDGSSAHVLLDYEELAPEAGMSLSAWVQPDSLQGSSWDTAIARGASGAGDLDCCGDSYWLGYYQYGLALYNNISGTITDSYIHDTSDYSGHVGSWHHLVGTWDAATGAQAIYLDGALVVSGTAYTYVIYDGSPTRIGADTNSASDVLHFDGLIDEVKVLDCALDAGQVATDFADNWPF